MAHEFPIRSRVVSVENVLLELLTDYLEHETDNPTRPPNLPIGISSPPLSSSKSIQSGSATTTTLVSAEEEEDDEEKRAGETNQNVNLF